MIQKLLGFLFMLTLSLSLVQDSLITAASVSSSSSSSSSSFSSPAALKKPYVLSYETELESYPKNYLKGTCNVILELLLPKICTKGLGSLNHFFPLNLDISECYNWAEDYALDTCDTVVEWFFGRYPQATARWEKIMIAYFNLLQTMEPRILTDLFPKFPTDKNKNRHHYEF